MLEPDELDEWLRGLLGDVDPGARETVATYARRLIVCDGVLALLADVPPYGWSQWEADKRAAKRRGGPSTESDPTKPTKEGRRMRPSPALVWMIERQQTRNAIAEPVRDLIRSYRDLLAVIEVEHGDGGEIDRESPANHVRKPWSVFARPTALGALEACPILGTECVEVGRSMLIEARGDLLSRLARSIEELLPVTHRLRQRGPASRLDPDLVTKDGALRETARKVLKASDPPVKALKNIAAKAELSLDEVKRWSGILQKHRLIERNASGDWARTPEGTRALEATSGPVGPP